MINPTRIMLQGDVHGDSVAVERGYGAALSAGCDAYVQLGDFGWWPHTDWGYTFVENVKALAVAGELPILFIDGNHDNHPDLWRSHVGVTAEGFHQLAERFFYLPRGLRFRWQGVGLLALGGGHSVDVHLRQPGKSWWPTELLSQEEIARATAGEIPVDIVLSHECPDGVDLGIDFWPIPLAERSRRDVGAIVDAVRPRKLFHGHYHVRRDSVYTNSESLVVETVGLADGSDEHGGDLYLLDLQAWKGAAA